MVARGRGRSRDANARLLKNSAGAVSMQPCASERSRLSLSGAYVQFKIQVRGPSLHFDPVPNQKETSNIKVRIAIV